MYATIDEKLIYSNLSDQALRVYLALKRHAGDKGKCWPSIKRLAALLSRGLDSIRRAITELVSAGVVVVAEKAGTSNTYKVKEPDEQGQQLEMFGPALRVVEGGKRPQKPATSPVQEPATPRKNAGTPLAKTRDEREPVTSLGRGEATAPQSRTEQQPADTVMAEYRRLFPESSTPNCKNRLRELREAVAEFIACHPSCDPTKLPRVLVGLSDDAAGRERNPEFRGLGGVDAALAGLLSEIGSARRRALAA